MTRTPVDYGAIRDQARFETVLANYGLQTRGHGAERMALCPFHDDRSPSCSINIEKNVFQCFACGEKGTILDFVAKMEQCSISESAQLVAGWCDLSSEVSARNRTAKALPESGAENEPLGFELPLDPRHPYLKERGVSENTISKFGLGYCGRGIMKGRICIPIHDANGILVAYAGRWPGSAPPPDEPRYKFPRGFKKRLVLFNLHRVREAEHLVIVEGYWSVFRLHSLGAPAVSLMGTNLSASQADLLNRTEARLLTLLLDADAAGRKATEELLPRLSQQFLVRVPQLPGNEAPDTVSENVLLEAAQL